MTCAACPGPGSSRPYTSRTSASAGSRSVALASPGPSAGARLAPSAVSSSRNWRPGSVVMTCTVAGSGLPRPAQWASIGRVSTIRATASPATVAAGSSATTMSQVCRACSDIRIRTMPSRSVGLPNMSSCQLSRSAGDSWPIWPSSAVSAASASCACCGPGLAFHRSQMRRNSSMPGPSVPASPALRYSAQISALAPRWEATWAIVQSSSYDWPASCSLVSGPTAAVSRSCELCRAASTSVSDGAWPAVIVMRSPSRWAGRAGSRPATGAESPDSCTLAETGSCPCLKVRYRHAHAARA